VWVGYDQKKMLGEGETGARAASPIWLDFMQDIHKNEPVRVFQVPEGVVFAKIDGDTGLLPGAGSRRTLFECFKEDTAPRAYSATTETISEPDHFFKQDM
jgi:penicillin-binding protein 1A